MGQALSEYQIRAFRDDGELSLIMLTPANSDDDARVQAFALLTRLIPTAEVWHDKLLIDTLRLRADAITSTVVGKRLA